MNNHNKQLLREAQQQAALNLPARYEPHQHWADLCSDIVCRAQEAGELDEYSTQNPPWEGATPAEIYELNLTQ